MYRYSEIYQQKFTPGVCRINEQIFTYTGNYSPQLMKILTLFLLYNTMNTIIIIDARTTKTKSKTSTTIPAMYPEVEAPAIGISTDSGDVDTVSLKPKK